MRLVLAIDTSGWRLGIALVEARDDGVRTLAEREVEVSGSHAPGLVGELDAALAAAGRSRDDPDAWVAVRGPGSFTGIRIALGTVQGLALATGRPALGVDTLAAAAEAHGAAAATRVVVMSAGRGEVWGASFDPASCPPAPQGGPWRVDVAALPGRVAGPAVLVGGAALDPPAPNLAGVSATPWPGGIAAAAARIALAARPGSLPASPLYLRPSDAELGRRA